MCIDVFQCEFGYVFNKNVKGGFSFQLCEFSFQVKVYVQVEGYMVLWRMIELEFVGCFEDICILIGGGVMY